MYDAEVMARVEACDAVFAGKVDEAAKLSELMSRNQLPPVTPAAFVIPLALRGGRADAATGLFRQAVEHVVSVIIVVRVAGDATGRQGKQLLEPLKWKVIEAIAGWGPDEAIGVFRLARGELATLASGAIVYQLDFILDDQLRIHTS